MKKIAIIVCSLVATSVTIFAQGTVNFANGAAGVSAPVSDPNGVPLAGSGFLADLYFVGGADQPVGSLASAGFAQAFAANGFFLGGTQSLPGTSPGQTVTAMVVAWRASDGSTFAEASSAPDGWAGMSNPINVDLGGGTIPNPNLVGLTAFQLVVVPEPTTLALAGLGAAALLIFRRRD